MPYTAHVDDFAARHLPDPAAWPELRFDLPALQYPERCNAASVLLERRIQAGDAARRAILAPGLTWTYGELYDRAKRIAQVLVEDLGMVAGNRVLMRAPNTPMLAACWFGVLMAGGIAVTTMPLYRRGELRHMLVKARVTLALCDARLREELDAAVAEVGDVRVLSFGNDAADGLEARMASKSGRFTPVPTAATDVALIAFTSGTTGNAKATMHFHRDVLAICDTYAACVLRPQADDLFCGSPPLGFTFGLGGLVLFPLSVGAATLLLERAGPEELLRAIAEQGVTTTFTAPIAYRTMCGLLDRYDVGSLRTCVSAGETLPEAVWKAWYARTGIPILDGIGSTEMLHIFIGAPRTGARAGSTGTVVPGYVAEVHDERGTRVPNGAVGRLAVKGPTGCRYLDDPRQATYVEGGWNYPGDAYRVDDEGYFTYVARTDDMIVSAGYNISGPEVEAALMAHDAVVECAVVAKRDVAHDTHIVKAFVVLREETPATDETVRALQSHCKSQIASYKAPREIAFVSALPRTQSGKIQRFRLREARETD